MGMVMFGRYGLIGPFPYKAPIVESPLLTGQLTNGEVVFQLTNAYPRGARGKLAWLLASRNDLRLTLSFAVIPRKAGEGRKGPPPFIMKAAADVYRHDRFDSDDDDDG